MACNYYNIEGAPSIDVEWLECDGTTNSDTVTGDILICAQTGSVTQTGGAGIITTLGSCSVTPTPTTTQTPTPDPTPSNSPTPDGSVTQTPTPTPTPTPTVIPNLCNEYTIDNQTESSISVSWYDCSNVLQSNPNLGSGQQTTFCANLSYGPIEYSNGSLYDLGLCPTPTPTNTPVPTNTPTPTPDPNFYYEADRYECQLDGSCLNTETLVIANDIELVLNTRFRLDPTTGYIFQVVNTTTPQIALYTNMVGLGRTSCSSFCTQPATNTPTPSPLPATNTPTPSPLPATDTPTPTPSPLPATDTPTPTPSPLPPTYTPTPTPTATPSLPDGVLDFGSSDSNIQQCGEPYGPNDYEYDITYTVNFTSPRSSYGYVLVYLSDNSPLSIPFNQNDTAASLTVPCGCGSECASIQYVMSIAYSTPTPTPEPLLPTSTPAPTEEGGGGGIDPI